MPARHPLGHAPTSYRKESNMQKILFFDIDGTLVGFDGKMSPSTMEVLRAARAKGHKIFLCTGRSLNQIYDYLLDFGFDGIVAAAGGYVEYQGEIIFHDVFGEKLIEDTFEKIAYSGTAMLVQNKAASVTTTDWGNTFLNIFAGQIGSNKLEDNPTLSKLVVDDDVAGYARKYADMESIIYCKCPYTIPELEQMLDDQLEITPSSFKEPDPYSGEITLKRTNKATGMQKVLDALDATREDTIAFGDGANDIDMLHFAGTGVAMGNAQDCAKKAADMITDDIREDGLRRAMEQLKLI